MKAVVTGGAGFLGSHLVDRVMRCGSSVIVVDNLSSGFLGNIEHHIDDLNFKFVKADLKIWDKSWTDALNKADVVLHFAAIPDVRMSIQEPRKCFEENVLTTLNVLEACRLHKVEYFVFASSSAVYGDPLKIPTPEDHPIRPISMYGASKAMGEALIMAYAKSYGFKALIMRYANIVGPRLRHGVIWDLINKLREDPTRLEILGDGNQRKSYLHVSDAIEATIRAFEHLQECNDEILVYNVSNRDSVSVREIADVIVEEMGLDRVEYVFKPATGNGRGWLGDVKMMQLDITKIIKEVGWQPLYSSKEVVRQATIELLKLYLMK